MKFTAFEADAVKPLVESSPLKDVVLLGAAVWSLGDALADGPGAAEKRP